MFPSKGICTNQLVGKGMMRNDRGRDLWVGQTITKEPNIHRSFHGFLDEMQE
jgi:hypothetical protein